MEIVETPNLWGPLNIGEIFWIYLVITLLALHDAREAILGIENKKQRG